MTRPAPRRIAACLAAGLLTALLIPLTHAASAEGVTVDEAPVRVSIDTLTPSTLPAKGKDKITVTGTITNRSDSSWTDLNAYLLTSAEPMRTAEELSTASTTDPTSEIGGRLFQPGLYDEVGDLAPGSSTDYVLSVARKDLEITGESGVYWLGVHVLGANEDGRDGVADGRARMFIPLMTAKGPTTSMSLVIPVKGGVRRQSDGRLTNLTGWQNLLGPDGRLGRLLQINASATDLPLTWVVDPAVIDAARSVAGDNPPTSTSPSTGQSTGQSTGGSTGGSIGTGGTSSPSSSPSSSDPNGSDQAPAPELSQDALQAADWLEQFRRQAGQHDVLTVPYGDLDVASVLRGSLTALYTQAATLSTETMSGLDVTSSSVVAPPSGFLPRVALDKVSATTQVLLSDQAFPTAAGPVVDEHRSPPVVLTDSSAGAGGPSPTPRFSALAVRQRILSEAALHALSPARDEPFVVSTPQLWDPGRDWQDADFFSGLDVAWLRGAGLPSSASDQGSERKSDPLVYPEAQRKAEIPFANLLASQELITTGNVFAGLLTLNDTVDESLAKVAMLASSNRARSHPNAAAVRARSTTHLIRFQMEKVHIDGPSFVTMSSGKGPIGVTIINGLQEQVTVGIAANTGSKDLVISSPDPVKIGPGERASVRLQATSQEIGVHSVTLTPTNTDGAPLGGQTSFNVRSSQVGVVIWVIMGIGAAVLLLAAGTRIVRRILHRKDTGGPALEEGAS